MPKKNYNSLEYKKLASARRSKMRAIFDRLDGLAKKKFTLAKGETWGRWQALGQDMGLSVHTFFYWTKTGRVPLASALALEQRYGTKLVKAKFLNSAE